MSRSSRVPGNFSHNSVGKSHRVMHPGWQQFFMNDPECTIEDPLNQCTGGDGSIVETSGATVFTFADGHSGGSNFPDHGCVSFKPLRDPFGNMLTFGKPFVVRIALELIDISGGYGTGSNVNQAQIVVGITQQMSNIDTAGAKILCGGYRLHCTGSQDIAQGAKNIYTFTQTDGSGRTTTVNSTALTNEPLMFATFFCGPDLDADYNCWMTFNHVQATGGTDPYDTPLANPLNKSLQDGSAEMADGNRVQIFVAVCDQDSNNGSNDPAVLTFKVHYMAIGAPEGWGGGGAV